MASICSRINFLSTLPYQPESFIFLTEGIYNMKVAFVCDNEINWGLVRFFETKLDEDRESVKTYHNFQKVENWVSI